MKTQLHRIMGWALILLAPVLMYASIVDAYNQNELNDKNKVSYVYANVLATQRYRGHLEARYTFQVVKNGTWFSSKDSLGRKNLWAVVTLHDWNNINSGSATIRVKYLTANPWINVPADDSESQLSDSITAIVLPMLLVVAGLCIIPRRNKHPVSSRVKQAQPSDAPIVPTHMAVGTARDTRMENDVKNKEYTRLPATFVVCQIAGVLTLLPALAYIWGGAIRERAMALLPYLSDQSWLWGELAVGVMLLGAGGYALITGARKRRIHRAMVK